MKWCVCARVRVRGAGLALGQQYNLTAEQLAIKFDLVLFANKDDPAFKKKVSPQTIAAVHTPFFQLACNGVVYRRLH